MDVTPLLPIRRLHNFVYCPRLFYFQWVENVFVENEETVSGDSVHKRVDAPQRIAVECDDIIPENAKVRSLEISNDDIGLVGVLDVVENNDGRIEIIDYKRGMSRVNSEGVHIPKEPDAIQVVAQAVLLNTQGIKVDKGWVYYAQEKRKVEVPLTAQMFDKCKDFIKQAYETAGRSVPPQPLQDGDPRCLHCSLYPICLPEETRIWQNQESIEHEIKRPPRPEEEEGEVLIVQKIGSQVGISNGRFEVRYEKEVQTSIPVERLNSLYLFGPIQITAQAMQTLLERDVPVAFFSASGRYYGCAHGLGQTGVDARRGQYQVFSIEKSRLKLAKETIRAKINNQRVMMMRNGEAKASDIEMMKYLRNSVDDVQSLDSLRGVEGEAAAIYFANFSTMLKDEAHEFVFNERNRRPPRDPVNALLSLAYSMLVKEVSGVCHSVGLDPYLGFFHQPRYGKPALALDLMEEFRPLIADSVVISLINRGEVSKSDFSFTTKGVYLNTEGRKSFWSAWFRRMDTLVSHPQFKYRMSYRRMIEVQVRQLWRYLRGETSNYFGFTTR